MEFKILVTGRMETIVKDVCNHLERDRGYSVVSCFPNRKQLFGTYLSELPQVIILCLGNETGKTVAVYDILKEYEAYDAAKILVIASPADRATFVAYTGLREILFLSRPLSLSALYYKLREIEEDWQAASGRLVSNSITEYVNERADTVPRKHIIAVDDDPEQLAQITEQLREFYTVTVVSSGENVLRYLSRYKVDLILLDYLMPDMDGVTVFNYLRADPRFSDIPVIFLIGASERDTIAAIIRQMKPESFVFKPTKKSELVAKIIDALG